jgi:hypothetical protein
MTRQVADQAPGRAGTYLCGYDSVLLYFRFPLVGLYPMTIAPPRRRWLRSSSSSSDDGATRGQGRPPARFPREIRVPTGSTRSGVNARLPDATCPGKRHLGLRSRHSSAAVVAAGSARNRALRRRTGFMVTRRHRGCRCRRPRGLSTASRGCSRVMDTPRKHSQGGSF